MDSLLFPHVSLLLPGLWHWLNDHSERGIVWCLFIVLTVPLVIPPIILWWHCWRDAEHFAQGASNK